MNILFCIDEIAGLHAGGTEGQLRSLIRWMRDSGHRCTLLVFRNPKNTPLTEMGADLHRDLGIAHLVSHKTALTAVHLMRWMRRERFDAVHCFFKESNLIIPPVARAAGVPLIIGHRRNLNYWVTPMWRFAQWFPNLLIDRFVANCSAVRDHIMKMELGVRSSIDVIPNGIDLERFRQRPPARTKVRSSLEIPANVVVVGLVASLRHVKRIDVFLRAVASAMDRKSVFHSLIVGGGPLRAELEELAQELSIARYVHFVGPQDQVVDWMSAMDIGVLTSDTEGLSNSILEYMAMGLPVIASDVGGNREAVGDAGLIFSSGNAVQLANCLRTLLDDPSRREVLARNAESRAQEFSETIARHRWNDFLSQPTSKVVAGRATEAE